MTSSSLLSPRDRNIIAFVTRFRMVTSAHILRLYFNDNSEKSRSIRMSRTMRRLVKWGHVRRLPRPIGGYAGGSACYIFTAPSSKSRIPEPHTLDISDVYVHLNERFVDKLLAFDPEPYCHVQIGHLELKPDAYLRIRTETGIFRYFLEVDRSTEWRSQLLGKMKRYVQAYNHWQEPTFPLCLWIVPDEQRLRLVEGLIKRSEIPGLFQVCLFTNAVSKLGG